MRNRTRSISLALAAGLALAPAAAAQPLTIVTVGAPQINCLFSTSCSVTVSDHAAPFLSTGFLQSRTFQGQPGSPAAGKWVYEYRVDLTSVVGLAAIPQVTSLSVPFPAPIAAMDYNGDRTALDQVFVVTTGGLGAVGPSSAVLMGDTIHFAFLPGINGGGSPGPAGQSSFFFGLVTDAPPTAVMARIEANVAPGTFLSARAPQPMAGAGRGRLVPGVVPRVDPPRPRPKP